MPGHRLPKRPVSTVQAGTTHTIMDSAVKSFQCANKNSRMGNLIRYAARLDKQIQKALDQLPGKKVPAVQIEDLIARPIVVLRTVYWHSGRACKEMLLLWFGLELELVVLGRLSELLQELYPPTQLLRALTASKHGARSARSITHQRATPTCRIDTTVAPQSTTCSVRFTGSSSDCAWQSFV